jgi:malonyl-CoA O-methyltransferase
MARAFLRSRLPRLVCGDAENLPLAAGSVQLVFSNLALQWCRPDRVFPEAARVLESEGPLHLLDLRPGHAEGAARRVRAVDAGEHVNTFIDMHDLGDALVHAGFADPVMEMEVVTLEYSSVMDVARDCGRSAHATPARPPARGSAAAAMGTRGRSVRAAAPQRRASRDLRGDLRPRVESRRRRRPPTAARSSTSSRGYR